MALEFIKIIKEASPFLTSNDSFEKEIWMSVTEKCYNGLMVIKLLGFATPEACNEKVHQYAEEIEELVNLLRDESKLDKNIKDLTT